MGIETELQAIPENCELLDRAKSDPEFGDQLPHLPSWYHRGSPSLPDYKDFPAERDFWEMAVELARRHPGLERRNAYLDRWYDKLHFVLSAKRRGEAAESNDELWESAIKGEFVLADHITSCQGFPVRYVTAKQVTKIAVAVEHLQFSDLVVNIDCQRMDEMSVYKSCSDDSPAEEAKFLSEYFTAFRDFYLDAAAHEEAALVVRM